MLIHTNLILDLLILALIREVEPNLSTRLAFLTPLRPSTSRQLQDHQVLPTTATAEPSLPSTDGVLTAPLPPTTAYHQQVDLSMEEAAAKTAPSEFNLQEAWSAENVQNCATLWNMSPQDTVKLQSLQQPLSDVDHKTNTPCELARYLNTFNGDVDSAQEKFRTAVEWRRTNGIDTLLQEYRAPSLYRYFPAAVLQGVDRDGDPIHVERTGAADSSGLLKRYGREAMLQHSIWLREVQSHGRWHQHYQEQYGHPVKQFTVVMDMHGLSTKNMSPALLSVGHDVSRIVQDYYSGYAKRVIFVRAPAIFRFAWNTFKAFVDDNMKDRIVFISGGDNNDEYCQALSEYLDPAVLPPQVCPGVGQGKAIDEFDTLWDGGRIPDVEEETRTPSKKRPSSMTSSILRYDQETTATSSPPKKKTKLAPTILGANDKRKPKFRAPTTVASHSSATTTTENHRATVSTTPTAMTTTTTLTTPPKLPLLTKCNGRRPSFRRRIRKFLSWPFSRRREQRPAPAVIEYCI
mmetsp:Transcript_15594/g.34053  ORF Transcript_15594/g.34053 Transcript_15594/m.34053 type:complete len:518 (-) Transcript_15594:114-1667(-)